VYAVATLYILNPSLQTLPEALMVESTQAMQKKRNKDPFYTSIHPQKPWLNLPPGSWL